MFSFLVWAEHAAHYSFFVDIVIVVVMSVFSPTDLPAIQFPLFKFLLIFFSLFFCFIYCLTWILSIHSDN
jgi:hypothetical protein